MLAVSVRSILSPKEIGVYQSSRKLLTSISDHPPSGPIKIEISVAIFPGFFASSGSESIPGVSLEVCAKNTLQEAFGKES